MPSNDTAYTKTAVTFTDPSNQFFGIEIIATPNPAKTWTAFDYTLVSDKCTGLITISDINGKEVVHFNISGKQGQQVWDTRNIVPGVYIYTISSLGSKKSGKLIIQ